MATRIRFVFKPTTRLNWLQRAIGLVLLATLAVLGFFFLAAALVAGAILAGVVVLRLWWLRRKLRATPADATYEGEYVVIERISDKSAATHAEPRDRPGAS